MRIHVLIPAILSGAILVGCQQQSPEELLNDAQQSMSQQDYKSAVVQLKNAAQLDPTNLAVRANLAKSLFELGDLSGAEKELRQVLRSNESDPELQSYLGMVLFHQGKFEDLLLWNEQHKETLPDMMLVLDYAAALRMRTGIERSYQAASDKISPQYRPLLNAYKNIAAGKYQDALDELKSASYPSYADVLIQRTNTTILQNLGRHDEALAQIAAAATKWPNVGVVAISYIELLVMTGDLAKADSVLQPWLSAQPNNPWFNLLMAETRYRQKNAEDTLLYAQKAAQVFENLARAQILGGIAAAQLEKWELAYKFLRKANSLVPNNAAVSKLLARAQLEMGYLSDVTAILNSVNIDNQDDLNFLMAATSVLHQRGETDLAISVLEKNLIEQSDNLPLLAQLSGLQLASGSPAAEATVEKLVASGSDSLAVAYIQIQHLIQKKDFAEAANVAKQHESVDKADGLTLGGLVLVAKGEAQTAFAYAQQALSIKPKDPSALRLASIAAFESADSKAAYEYTKTLMLTTDDQRFVDDFLYVADMKAESTENDLLLLKQQNPELKTPKLALIKYFAANQRFQQATAEIENSGTVLITGNERLFANIYLADNKLEKAKTILTNWQREEPGNIDTYLSMFGFFAFSEQYEQALGSAISGEERFPGDTRLMVLELSALIKLKRFEQAEQVLSKLRTTDIPKEIIYQFAGEKALAERDLREAKDNFTKAYNINKGFKSLLMVANVYALEGNFDEGIAKLTSGLQASANTTAQQYHTVAEYATYGKVYTKAAEIYTKLLEKWPDDAAAHNNLASVLIETGSYDKALASAKAANDIETSPYYQDTLGWAFHLSGDSQSAEPLLEGIIDNGDVFEDAAAHLAVVKIALGKTAEAAKLKKAYQGQRSDLAALWNKIP